eukprot:jgi/Mesvir1/7885/Mv11818-RA.1
MSMSFKLCSSLSVKEVCSELTPSHVHAAALGSRPKAVFVSPRPARGALPQRRLHVVAQAKGFGQQEAKPAAKAPLDLKSATSSTVDDDFDPNASEEGLDATRDEVPQIVTDRMLTRMVTLSGIPMLVGFSSLPLFWYLKTVKGMDIPVVLAYGTSGLFFALAMAGISYGVISASWDPARPGSLLGIKEAQANLPVLMENINKNKKK